MEDDLLRRRWREGMARTGFSMRELGERAGLNVTSVQQILSGRSKNPRIDTVRRAAYVLGDDPRSYLTPTTTHKFLDAVGGDPRAEFDRERKEGAELAQRLRDRIAELEALTVEQSDNE